MFDWLRGRRSDPAATEKDWQVCVEDGWLEVRRLDGNTFAHVLLGGARAVRVVPLTRGTHHASASGWQVALSQPDGDALVGQPLAGWQAARDLAQKVCGATRLPMDEMTEKLFSRVGQMKL